MLITGKKDILAHLLFKSGVTEVCHSIRKNNFIGLSYHRIKAEIEKHNIQQPYPFCDDVFGPTQSQFYDQMKWLSRHAYPISETEVIHHLDTHTPLPPKSVLVTFDDAYSDNYSLAYPILRHFKIPAIFFVPTKFIEERILGWWDIISYLIKKCPKKILSFNKGKYLLDPNPSLRIDIIRKLHGEVKGLHMDLTQEYILQLSFCCDVQLPTKELQSKELMTWEQISEISKNGIQIGSHTHSHRVLSSLSLQDQHKELAVSKQILERHINKAVRSFAFPVGGYEHFHKETHDILHLSGYRLGFTYLTGYNKTRSLDRYDIRRMSVPPHLSRFASILTFPHIFSESFCSLDAPTSISELKWSSSS